MLGKRNGKCLTRSLRIAPFLDNKIIAMLKMDKKKIKNGCAEFDGCFNPYVISLIKADLKERNIL